MILLKTVRKLNRKPIVYPSNPLLGNTYLDVIKSDGLLYFGTPGEYGAENQSFKIPISS